VSSSRPCASRRRRAKLIVAKVQDTIDQGKVADPGPMGSRNRLQTVTLLDAITDNSFDAAFGGARRDEDKARAKERILSPFATPSVSGIPANSAPNSGSSTRAR
jgi:3'-phosphoadenosine 5'-phosphosulfate sulfotransferase (PAPS reductase)/FAD synthetase